MLLVSEPGEDGVCKDVAVQIMTRLVRTELGWRQIPT